MSKQKLKNRSYPKQNTYIIQQENELEINGMAIPRNNSVRHNTNLRQSINQAKSLNKNKPKRNTITLPPIPKSKPSNKYITTKIAHPKSSIKKASNPTSKNSKSKTNILPEIPINNSMVRQVDPIGKIPSELYPKENPEQETLEKTILEKQEDMLGYRFILEDKIEEITDLLVFYHKIPKGSIKFSHNIVNTDEKEGLFKFTGFLINDKREGWGREVHMNGNLKYEGLFINNGRHGKSITLYWSNGNVYFEGDYINGKREGFGKEYHQDRLLRYEGQWLNDEIHGDNVSINYADGSLHFSGNMVQGKKSGLCTVYHSNNNIRSFGNFEDDKLNGDCVEIYFDNGMLKYKGQVLYNKMQGYGKEYWITGGVKYSGGFG